VNRIIIATTDKPEDDLLASLCEGLGLLVFRGSQDDVLLRMLGAAERFGCEKIVRVCGDNPLIDSELIDVLIENFAARNTADYCTYVTREGIPLILKPLGIVAEVVTAEALKKVASLTASKKYREHVTMFIYENPKLFNITTVPLPEGIDADLRFTVDYIEDVEICERVLQKGGGAGWRALLQVIEGDAQLKLTIQSFEGSHKKRY